MPKIPKIILLMDERRKSGRMIIEGVTRYTRSHGQWNFYWTRGWFEFENPFQNWQEIVADADGIFFDDLNNQYKPVKTGLPAIGVLGSRKLPEKLNYITAENEIVGKLAAEHLLKRAFKIFAFFGHDPYPWSKERRQSFSKRIAESGFTTHVYQALQSKKQLIWKTEQPHVFNWLKSLPKPAGLMVCNDDHGEQIIECCQILNIRVPYDLAVISVDNDELVCNLSNPTLSSVAIDFEEAGFQAAVLLDRMMKGEKITGQRINALPTHVVERQSTDVLIIDDEDTKNAVLYIRRNADKAIQVREVSEAVSLSRRVLERRFKALLGHTVLDEIRHARADRVVKMLLETNYSIQRIAVILGFTDSANLSHYFFRIKGLSPNAYRREFGHK